MEPWHADIFEFLDAKKNTGTEETRARDLFYALWIPDLFMKRVESSGNWTLFCPDEAPGLQDTYGEEFEALYEKYEKEGRGRTTIKAQALWYKVIEAQIEVGVPYMLYKVLSSFYIRSMNFNDFILAKIFNEIFRTHAIENQIKKIWEQSNVLICAQRLSSTPMLMKLQSVIWLQSLCLHSLSNIKMENSILISEN